MDTPETVSAEEKKPRARRTPPPAALEPEAAPEAKPEPEPRAETVAQQWLRYTGQTPAVFLDLGGEIEPGQVVRPRDAQLTGVLLKRDDFETAEAPTPDPDAGSGTAN